MFEDENNDESKRPTGMAMIEETEGASYIAIKQNESSHEIKK